MEKNNVVLDSCPIKECYRNTNMDLWNRTANGTDPIRNKDQRHPMKKKGINRFSTGNSKQSFKKSGSDWTPLLLLTCIGTTIGTTVPVGYFLGVVNAPAASIQDWIQSIFIRRGYATETSDIKIEMLWATIVAIFVVGGMVGSFFAGWYSDLFGRKGCLLLSAFLLIVSGIFMFISHDCHSMELLLIGRFIGGLASALIFTSHPMYIVEIAPSTLGSIAGMLACIGVSTGALIGAFVSLPQIYGNDRDWPLAFSFYLIFVGIGFLPAYWYPESPRWLYVIKHNNAKARVALERLRHNASKVEVELEQIHESAQFQTKKESWSSICKRYDLLLPFVLVCSLQACQQLTGINAIFYYSISTFTLAGFSETNAGLMNLGLGAFNLFAAFFGSFFVHLCSRRRMLITSFIGIGISLVGITFSLHYIDTYVWLRFVPIVCMTTFIAFFQLGVAPIAYFIGSELFDVSPRPFAMSFGSFFNWLGNFLIALCFPLLQRAIGAFAFLPCAVVAVYALILVYFYLPETRGRSVAEVSALMRDGFKSKVRKS